MEDSREYKSGEEIPGSGVYALSHPTGHHENHEITLLYGSRFPSCKQCGPLTFRLVVGAHSTSYYDFLAKG